MTTSAGGLDETSELRRVCHEYYLVQQELQRAESDHTNAEQVVESLTAALEAKRRAARSLKLKNDELQKRLPGARHRREADVSRAHAESLHGIPPRDAEVAGEEVLRHVKAECANLVSRTLECGESLALLERSLQAQLRFNNVIATEETRAVEKQMTVQQRIDSLRARLKSLDNSISQEQQRLRRLRQDVTTRRANLERLEASAREQDSEVVRQKRDASFARRIYLGEVEHAREQTAWLEELMIENKKLHILLKRLGSLPGKAAADASTLSSPDERDGDDDAEGGRRKGIVAQFQQHNLLLLQQLVNSMQLLESELITSVASQ